MGRVLQRDHSTNLAATMVTLLWVKVFCIALKWEDGTQVSPFVSEVSAF